MFKNFYNYIVFDDGRVYSKHSNKFLKQSIVCGYAQYTLYIDGCAKRYKAHRLVALCFISNPENLPQVNHKDGNKLNNNIGNLEWCTSYYNNKHARDNGLNNISKSNSDRWKIKEFRERTSKNISIGRLKNGSSAGENNPRFKYRIYMNGEIIARKKLPGILNLSIGRCDTLIREATHGKIPKIFIDKNITVINTKESQQTIEMIV